MSRSAYNDSYPEPDGRSGTHVPIKSPLRWLRLGLPARCVPLRPPPLLRHNRASSPAPAHHRQQWGKWGSWGTRACRRSAADADAASLRSSAVWPSPAEAGFARHRPFQPPSPACLRICGGLTSIDIPASRSAISCPQAVTSCLRRRSVALHLP